MLVSEYMTKSVEIGSPDMTLQQVAQMMREGDFGILPIGENDRLLGMITDRDLVIRAIAEGKDIKTTLANDIMSFNVLYCYEDQTLSEVTENFGKNQIRRLPVLNRQKRLVGILSLGDVAQANENPEKIGQTLDQISRYRKPIDAPRLN